MQKVHQQSSDTFCRSSIAYEVLWVCTEPKVASSALPLEAKRLDRLPGRKPTPVNSILPQRHGLFDSSLILPLREGDSCSERLIPEEFRVQLGLETGGTCSSPGFKRPYSLSGSRLACTQDCLLPP